MPRIAAFVFISTLSFVVPASAADKGNSQWRPMWNVAHASASRLQVPLAIWVDEPSIIAKQSGVTRGMVERIVELFFAKKWNSIRTRDGRTILVSTYSCSRKGIEDRV